MKKKIIGVLLCVAMTSTLMAGCGSSSDDFSTEEETTEEDTTGEETTEEDTTGEETAEEDTTEEETAETIEEDISGNITVWEHTPEFEDSLVAVIEGFNEHYPNVEVEYEIKESETYYSLLTTAIQGGESPDVFWTNGTSSSNMADLADNGVLMELTNIIDYGDIEEDSLQIATINDSLYSVPWMTLDTRCCYYNKDIFEEEGWSVPTTFAEFEELLELQMEAGYIPLAQNFTDCWNDLFIFEPVLAAMEPEYTEGLSDYSVKAADEEVANAINEIIAWMDAGYFGEAPLGTTDDGAMLSFSTGQSVMKIGGSWDVTTIQGNNPDLNLGAFQIPDNNGTRGMVGTFANGFSIAEDTENPEAAIAFVQYCATLEAQTIWVQTVNGVSGSPNIEASTEIVQEISDADCVYTSWQSVLANYALEGESATTIFEEDFPKVFSGEITTDEFLESIDEVMQ